MRRPHIAALAVVLVVVSIGAFFLVPVASFITYEPNMVCYGFYGVCSKPAYVSLSCEFTGVGIAWVSGSPATYNTTTGKWGGWHFQSGCPPPYPVHH
jgi:hypothetical protein